MVAEFPPMIGRSGCGVLSGYTAETLDLKCLTSRVRLVTAIQQVRTLREPYRPERASLPGDASGSGSRSSGSQA